VRLQPGGVKAWLGKYFGIGQIHKASLKWCETVRWHRASGKVAL
jgi:hypothetical protein